MLKYPNACCWKNSHRNHTAGLINPQHLAAPVYRRIIGYIGSRCRQIHRQTNTMRKPEYDQRHHAGNSAEQQKQQCKRNRTQKHHTLTTPFVGQFTQIRPYNKGRQPESATNQPDIGRCTAQHLHILRQYRNIQIKSSIIQKISQAKQNKIH